MGVWFQRIQLSHGGLYECGHLRGEGLESTSPGTKQLAVVEPLLESFEGEELDEETKGSGDRVGVGVAVEEEEDPVQTQDISQEQSKPGNKENGGLEM